MADNVAITAGSGTSIATDDVSGVHYQRVKLSDPTADSSANIGVHDAPLITRATTAANIVTGTASATGTGDTSVISGGGSGVYLYITSIVVHNSSTTDTYVTIKDGTTARLVFPAPAKGGAALALPTPLRLSDNTDLQFASAASVTTMFVSAVGYKGA